MPGGNGLVFSQIAAPERMLRGKNVRILVPRSNEMPALKPVIDRLASALPVREVQELDTRARVAAASAKMHANGVGREHDAVRAAIFELHDTWLRLNALAGLLADRESAVLELHAIGKTGAKNEFGRHANYRPLSSSMVMIRNELWIEEYYEPLRNALDMLGRSNGVGAFLAGCFDGLDVHAIAKGKDDALGTLSESLGRVAMLGIPSEKRKVKAPDGTKPRTEFEKHVLCSDFFPSSQGTDGMLAILALFHEGRIATRAAEETHSL